MSPNYKLLRHAILHRKQVVAEYKGHLREMCPHILGWKDGREKVLLYQFAGGTSRRLDPPGSPNNWRCLFVEYLANVRLQDGPWHTGPRHGNEQSCIDRVELDVNHPLLDKSA